MPSILKLTFEQAEEIRNMYMRGGYSHAVLGRMFDVTPTTIRMIVTNQTYKTKRSFPIKRIDFKLLNFEQATAVRKMSQEGWTMKYIASLYGVSEGVIFRIITNRRYVTNKNKRVAE